MMPRLPPLVALVLGAFVLLLGPATGTSAAPGVATSEAFAIRIVIPGQAGATEASISAPSDSSTSAGAFAFPADGSVLTTGAITATASALPAPTRAAAAAGTEIGGLSFFGGEFTVAVVDARVSARASSDGSTGDFTGTGVSGVGGTLGNWGTYSIGSGVGGSADEARTHGWRGSVTALDVRLTADHGGLPAGSEILVGYAAASVQADAGATTTTTPTETKRATVPTTTRATTTNAKPKAPQSAPAPKATPQPPIGKVPQVQPKLTAGRYVFPVYGDAGYSDTFGAPRSDVSWHHGDDIFAPLGAPVLAVADGTVFSVGWNPIGGWRLWLRDRQGNEFYYAHLSAYSPYALNNAQVRAGTVLGFVGNTGDAEGTPYHLHFEIHPVALLGLGYDGAVDPTPYLDAWRRVQDVRFSTNGAWLPGLVRLTPSRAPEPGAILLEITDISSASGLDPGSLRRALAMKGGPTGALAAAAGPTASASGGDLGRG